MILILLLIGGLSKKTTAPYFYKDSGLIMAHRGASGYIPEHSLPSYQIAAYMGADFLEIDAIVTKDSEFIINHDIVLDTTTDISLLPQLADYKTEKVVISPSGVQIKKGWFSEDLTLNQVRQLKLKQREAQRVHSLDFSFKIQILREVIEWALEENEQRTTAGEDLIGLYIELKYPEYYNFIQYDVETLLVNLLKEFNIESIAGATLRCPIIIQCFELDSLQKIGRLTDLPLVYLMGIGSPDSNLSDFADDVNGIGADLKLIFNDTISTGFVKKAHDLNLAVHPWTIQDDKLPDGLTVKELYDLLNAEQVDGVITEFPDTANIYLD